MPSDSFIGTSMRHSLHSINGSGPFGHCEKLPVVLIEYRLELAIDRKLLHLEHIFSPLTLGTRSRFVALIGSVGIDSLEDDSASVNVTTGASASPDSLRRFTHLILGISGESIRLVRSSSI